MGTLPDDTDQLSCHDLHGSASDELEDLDRCRRMGELYRLRSPQHWLMSWGSGTNPPTVQIPPSLVLPPHRTASHPHRPAG